MELDGGTGTAVNIPLSSTNSMASIDGHLCSSCSTGIHYELKLRALLCPSCHAELLSLAMQVPTSGILTFGIVHPSCGESLLSQAFL